MKKINYLILGLLLSISIQAQQVDIVKLYNQAQMAVEMDYLDDAIGLYKQILEINPKFAKGYLELGNIYLKKGQDVNSVKNAIHYFTEYLHVDPQAGNASQVKTTLDKLEFVLGKSQQKKSARDFLQGRWASTDGRTDKYGRSLFIFDMKEFDNKIKVDIEPSSLLYSSDFTTKTVYIDNLNANEYVITFINENVYEPSQAKHNLTSNTINRSTSKIFGGSSLGDLAGDITQYLNESRYEKDVRKVVKTVYELKMNPIPNESREFECKGRLQIIETTNKDQIVLDSVFVTGLYRVPNNYKNEIPLETKFGMSKEATKAFKSADNKLSNHSDPEISGLYKSGKKIQTTGQVLVGLGLGSMLGVLVVYVDPDGDLQKIAPPVIVGGAIVGIAGIPFMVSGSKKMKQATELYNESLENERTKISEIKVGFTGNGVGLVVTF